MNTCFFPLNKKILSSGYIFCRFFTIFNFRKAETHFIHCPWAGPHGLRLASGAWAFAQDCDLRWRVVDRWWRWGAFWKTKICWKFLNLPALKLTFSHLKIDSWNTIVSFWGPAYFQGRTVSFRQGRFFLMNFHNILWLIANNKSLPRSFRFEEQAIHFVVAMLSSHQTTMKLWRFGKGEEGAEWGTACRWAWLSMTRSTESQFDLPTLQHIFFEHLGFYFRRSCPRSCCHAKRVIPPSGFYFWIGCPGTIPPKSPG